MIKITFDKGKAVTVNSTCISKFSYKNVKNGAYVYPQKIVSNGIVYSVFDKTEYLPNMFFNKITSMDDIKPVSIVAAIRDIIDMVNHKCPVYFYNKKVTKVEVTACTN